MLQDDNAAEGNLCERTCDLFGQPDVLVDEYLDAYQSSLDQTPEVRLVAALLKDGIECYRRYLTGNSRRGEKRLANEASEWIFSKDEEWPFSFENVCGILRVEPDYIRRILLRYNQKYPQLNDISEQANRSRPPCRAA